MIKDGWKVVLRCKDLLKCVVMKNEPASILFKEEEWIEPNEGNGPITLFIDLEDAENFMNNCKCWGEEYRNNMRLYRCEYEPSGLVSVWQKRIGIHSVKESLKLCFCPNGTVLAKRIRLKGKIALCKDSK